MLRRLAPRDDGVGVVTALMVSFIVFALAAVWYRVSVHELDEVAFDRHRTASLHVADAGVRQAMYELGKTVLDQDPFWEGTGLSGPSTCNPPVQLTTRVDGVDEEMGRYWVQVTDATPADPLDHRYFIESWGWAPSIEARQASLKKVEQEVEVTVRESFVFALFAGSGGLVAGNRKTIYGDVYSGPNMVVSNSTDVLDNGAFPGDGNVTVAGGLSISPGSNFAAEGTVIANDWIDDRKGASYVRDVLVPQGDAYFEAGTAVGGTIRVGGVLLPGSNVGGAPVVEGATLEPVVVEPLPSYDWNTAKLTYGPSAQEYATWNDFINNYYNPNRGALTGEHYVKDPGSYTWRLNAGTGAVFADNFVLVVDGQLDIRGGGSVAPGAAPVTVSVIGNQATSSVILGQQFLSTEDLRWLVYSKGEFGASSLTTVYGVVYGERDVSSNNLTVFYRPPASDNGFSFVIDRRIDVEPLVWREVPEGSLPCDLP